MERRMGRSRFLLFVKQPQMRRATLCNNNQNKFKTTYERSDKARRLVAIKIETKIYTLKVTNIYAPNIPKRRKRFFEKLETYIRNDTKNILGGDFNIPKIGQAEIRRPNIMA